MIGLRRGGIIAPMRPRPKIRFSLFAIALLTGTLACRAQLTADLQVDGQIFAPNSCRSGQINGFAGVDLIDDGRTLRVVQKPTTEPQVILLDNNQVIDFGQCGSMTLERQNSVVNEITNVMGNATLNCSAAGHTVEGTVSFKNCH